MFSRYGREQRGGQGEFLLARVGAPILSNLNNLLGSFNKVLAQPSRFDHHTLTTAPFQQKCSRQLSEIRVTVEEQPTS